jgi:hypothetical protein
MRVASRTVVPAEKPLSFRNRVSIAFIGVRWTLRGYGAAGAQRTLSGDIQQQSGLRRLRTEVAFLSLARYECQRKKC